MKTLSAVIDGRAKLEETLGVQEGASEEDEVLDEEFLYEVEEEWRQECLTEIWKYDAPRALAKLDAEAGEFVDHMTEGDFNIMWYEAVDLYGRVAWIYEENQAYPAGFDNKAVPALLEWIRDRFADWEQQAGTLGWVVVPESPDELATTEWGYASPGGTPDRWFAHRWQALEAAASDMSFRDVQLCFI